VSEALPEPLFRLVEQAGTRRVGRSDLLAEIVAAAQACSLESGLVWVQDGSGNTLASLDRGRLLIPGQSDSERAEIARDARDMPRALVLAAERLATVEAAQARLIELAELRASFA
jgi:hypothetical protein